MLGRPEITEAAPYYFNYINQVPGEEVFSILEWQLEEAQVLFGPITEEKSRHRYAPEKWSIRQVLNHVTDSERAFAFRALWFSRGFEAPLPSYDQDVAAAGACADQTHWAAHREEFRLVRRATIALFQNLPPEGWLRSGIASDNPFTVRALAWIIAGHFTHHATILRERYVGLNIAQA